MKGKFVNWQKYRDDLDLDVRDTFLVWGHTLSSTHDFPCFMLACWNGREFISFCGHAERMQVYYFMLCETPEKREE